MSEEIKKTEQTELSAGGGSNGKKGYGIGTSGDAVSIAPKTPARSLRSRLVEQIHEGRAAD